MKLLLIPGNVSDSQGAEKERVVLRYLETQSYTGRSSLKTNSKKKPACE